MNDLVYNKHIFVCTNQRAEGAPRRSCGESHGMDIVDEFRRLLKEKKLPMKIRAQKSGCLDICEFGQTVAVYPDGIFYVGVELKDVAEIIDEHIVNNRPVERLRFRRRE
jgi:(2Fe-2S) ferredoxin